MTREEAKLVLRSWGVPKGREYEAIMTLIPELAESEDERIRKELIQFLRDYPTNLPNGKYSRSDFFAWLEKQKEQKPNIELIQRSWYMEGYHDRKFNKEPRWIIKIGEGGPRYEENPKYGQIIEQKPVEWSEDFDKEVENVHKRYPEVSYAKLTRIAYHFSKWANRYKDTEWSEDDETYLQDALWCIEKAEKVAKDEGDMGACWSARRWLKSLRPVSKESLQSWKPSEEQIYSLGTVVKGAGDNSVGSIAYNLNKLYEQLKKLI